MNKQDVENLLKKYSQVNLNISQKPEKDDKDSNSTSSLYDYYQTQPQINLNIIHMETTAVEEYELIQNIFHSIIRQIKQERFSLNLLSLDNQTNDRIKSVPGSYKTKPKLSNSKRTKSPKNSNEKIDTLNLNSNILLGGLTSEKDNITISNNNSNTSTMSNSYPHSRNSSPSNKDGGLHYITQHSPNSSQLTTLPNTPISKKNSSKFPFFKILNKTS